MTPLWTWNVYGSWLDVKVSKGDQTEGELKLKIYCLALYCGFLLFWSCAPFSLELTST